MSAVAPLLIDRNVIRWLSCPDSRLKAKAILDPQDLEADDPGWVEGYAATWGAIDQETEAFDRGVFLRSIQQRVAAGKVKLSERHWAFGGDAPETIGTIVAAREDDHGLFVRAIFSGVNHAQDMRRKVLEGHVRTLSVGFGPIRWEVDESGDYPILHHKEAMLAEVTLTVRPVNEQAQVTAAKSINSEAKEGSRTQAPRDIDANEPGGNRPATSPPAPPVSTRIQRDLVLRRAQLQALELNS